MKHQVAFIAFFTLNLFCYNPANAADDFEINLQELQPKPTATKPSAAPAFEINLKELQPNRPAAVKPATPARSRKTRTAKKTELPKQGESIYTVRPGDHLFLILMRHYRLSNDAAENLIPEIMRRNHVSRPHGLTIGQRLNIPLAAPENQRADYKNSRTGSSSSNNRRPEPEERENTEIPDTGEAEEKFAEALPEPVISAPTPAAVAVTEAPQKRSNSSLQAAIIIPAASSCGIARAIVDRTGLLAPDLIRPQADQEIVSAVNAGLKVVIACGLSAAEIYTYERLLSQMDTTLLVFKGNESYARVVEKLANRLGLDYEPVSPDANEDLPLGFIISRIGADEHTTRLTIVPASK